MRVGVFYFPDISGTSHVTFSLVSGLQNKGYDVVLITPRAIVSEFSLFSDINDSFEVKQYIVRAGSIPNFYRFTVPMYIKKLRRLFDIIINPQGPLLYDTSDIVWFDFPRILLYPEYLGRGRWFLLKSFMDISVKLGKWRIIVANSRYSQKMLRRFWKRDSIVIYPPINLDKLYALKEKDERMIISISRFDPVKRHEDQIRIVENLIREGLDVKLYMVGGVEPTRPNQVIYYNRIKKMVASRNLTNNITILSNIPFNRLRNLLAKAKIFLHTCKLETICISALEAMASKCIPILPRTESAMEYVPDELLFNSLEEASKLTKQALDGKFDYLLQSIENIVKRFDEKKFQNQWVEIIEGFSRM